MFSPASRLLVSLVILCSLVAVTTMAGIAMLHAQSSEDVEDRRERLRNELDQVQQEIQQNQQKLQKRKQEARSLQRDIEILEAEIRDAQLQIEQKEIRIQQLGKDISSRTETIEELNGKIANAKDSLGKLVRETNELDNISMVEVMLKHENLSDFFVRIDEFENINESLHKTLANIRDLKRRNREQKEQLQGERNAVQDAKIAIENQKERIERKEAEQEELLAIKRSEQRSYEARIQQQRQRAQEIRTTLFALRDSSAIPFGEALEYANKAHRQTGVRPAFLLAILKQESELGENVGTCNRPGDPPSKSWREIMPGPEDNSWRNDIANFKKITNELGIDRKGLPLSCPQYGGWGGAMGPSQFIPTTWMQYKPRISQALGGVTPDPWNPEHAFIASGLYLADLGAGAGGYTAERRAALKYYAGSNWNQPKNAFYGNQVMNKAQNIQENMIEPLQEVE